MSTILSAADSRRFHQWCAQTLIRDAAHLASSVTALQLQPGPCMFCGLTNYPLSMGGARICPACDCGIQPSDPRHPLAHLKLLAQLNATLGLSPIKAACLSTPGATTQQVPPGD